MDLNTAIEQLRQLDVKAYLRKATHGGYICPHCGSGENGTHNTGAVKYYQQTGTASCHACKRKVDAIDLYQHETGLEFVEAVKALASEQGITIDRTGSGWRNNSTAAEDLQRWRKSHRQDLPFYRQKRRRRSKRWIIADIIGTAWNACSRAQRRRTI